MRIRRATMPDARKVSPAFDRFIGHLKEDNCELCLTSAKVGEAAGRCSFGLRLHEENEVWCEARHQTHTHEAQAAARADWARTFKVLRGLTREPTVTERLIFNVAWHRETTFDEAVLTFVEALSDVRDNAPNILLCFDPKSGEVESLYVGIMGDT